MCGAEVWVAKKAQLVCSDLMRRYAARDPLVFAFRDHAGLTAFAGVCVAGPIGIYRHRMHLTPPALLACAAADNVLPAVLRQAGILVVDAALAARIDARESLPASDREHTELRAATVTACDTIAQRCVAIARRTPEQQMWRAYASYMQARGGRGRPRHLSLEIGQTA
jgi:hypothetical protein